MQLLLQRCRRRRQQLLRLRPVGNRFPLHLRTTRGRRSEFPWRRQRNWLHTYRRTQGKDLEARPFLRNPLLHACRPGNAQHNSAQSSQPQRHSVCGQSPIRKGRSRRCQQRSQPEPWAHHPAPTETIQRNPDHHGSTQQRSGTPDLRGHYGVTIQGASVGPDGSFAPAPAYTLPIIGSQIQVCGPCSQRCHDSDRLKTASPEWTLQDGPSECIHRQSKTTYTRRAVRRSRTTRHHLDCDLSPGSAEELGATNLEWKSSSPKWGWTLSSPSREADRLSSPCAGCFRASFILGRQGCRVARERRTSQSRPQVTG